MNQKKVTFTVTMLVDVEPGMVFHEDIILKATPTHKPVYESEDSFNLIMVPFMDFIAITNDMKFAYCEVETKEEALEHFAKLGITYDNAVIYHHYPLGEESRHIMPGTYEWIWIDTLTGNPVEQGQEAILEYSTHEIAQPIKLHELFIAK